MGFPYKGVAPALNQLLAQLNDIAPRRSKLSDGALGDQAHAARFSYHNPDEAGIVRARDFTHDPAGGLDCNWLAGVLTASGDPRILEIIWNRRYWTPRGGWVPYTGTNPHDKHLHLSVNGPALYNSTTPWSLGTNPQSEEFTVGQYEAIMATLTNIRDDGWKQHSDSQNVRAAYHAQTQARIAGLTELIGQLQVGESVPVDLDAIEAAGRRGAESALKDLRIEVNTGDSA